VPPPVTSTSPGGGPPVASVIWPFSVTVLPLVSKVGSPATVMAWL
jgi:hypothetical protein